jgi:hypothetical protein
MASSINAQSDATIGTLTKTGDATGNLALQTIRTQASDRVAVISACTTIEQLAALPSVQWANDPNSVNRG